MSKKYLFQYGIGRKIENTFTRDTGTGLDVMGKENERYTSKSRRDCERIKGIYSIMIDRQLFVFYYLLVAHA